MNTIIGGIFSDQTNDYQLLKNDSAIISIELDYFFLFRRREVSLSLRIYFYVIFQKKSRT
jgi:hypothetical protein